jgi:hypothetical protein
MPASGDNVKSTDNSGRKWGWENGASCAFKVRAWLRCLKTWRGHDMCAQGVLRQCEQNQCMHVLHRVWALLGNTGW